MDEWIKKKMYIYAYVYNGLLFGFYNKGKKYYL